MQVFRGWFVEGDAVGRLRAELRRQLKASAITNDTDAVRRELRKVDAKISKASQRLVEVDADLFEVVQQQVRTLRQEQPQAIVTC